MNFNSKAPLVSVLMPSYNHELYIEEAIMSVMNQTYKNIELIVLDDGSTDNTPNIISSLHKKYNFIYKRRKNEGLIKTLEELFLLSNGNYISLFSSDDVYDKKKFEILVDFMEKNKQFSMVYSKIGIIDSSSKLLEYIDENYKSGFIFDDLLKGDFFINGITTLIRRNIYSKYNRFNEYIDDYQFWLMISKENQIGFIDEYLAFYRKHFNHMSGNIYKMQQSEYKIISNYKDERIYKEALRRWNIKWLNIFCEYDKRYAIKNLLIQSFTYKNFIKKSYYRILLNLFLPKNILKKTTRDKND